MTNHHTNEIDTGPPNKKQKILITPNNGSNSLSTDQSGKLFANLTECHCQLSNF